jgi:hypothetical protein
VACQNGGAEPGARLQRQQVGPGVAEWLQAEPCHRCRPCIRDSQFHSDKWVLKAAPCALHLSSESSQKCPHNYSALSMQKVVSIGHGQDHDVDTPPPLPPFTHTHARCNSGLEMLLECYVAGDLCVAFSVQVGFLTSVLDVDPTFVALSLK